MPFSETIARDVKRELKDSRFQSIKQQELGISSGRVFFVMATTRTNYTQFVEDHPDYKSGDGVVTIPAVYNTLQAAVAACTASQSDRIYVTEGYTQTISDATTVAFNLAGIQIVGLGRGGLRPKFTLDTVATAKIAVTANNVSINNCVFVANFADIATVFNVSGASDFIVDGCEFRDTSAILNFLTIVTTVVSTTTDGLTFINNRVFGSGTTAATTPIKIANTISRVKINDNFVSLAVLNNTSALLAHGALVVTNLEMARNRVIRPNTDTATGGLLITTSSTTNTGMVYDNYVSHADTAAAILVTAGCKYGMFNNLADGDADASGFVLPAIGVD